MCEHEYMLIENVLFDLVNYMALGSDILKQDIQQAPGNVYVYIKVNRFWCVNITIKILNFPICNAYRLINVVVVVVVV